MPVLVLGGIYLGMFTATEAAGIGVTLDAADLGQLFGEDQARYLLACPAAEAETLIEAAAREGVPAAIVGRFGGDRVTLGTDSAPLAELSQLYRTAFARAIHGDVPDHA